FFVHVPGDDGWDDDRTAPLFCAPHVRNWAAHEAVAGDHGLNVDAGAIAIVGNDSSQASRVQRPAGRSAFSARAWEQSFRDAERAVSRAHWLDVHRELE